MTTQSPTLASQATAELPKLPEPKQHAPIYPDESREDQYAAARYVTGWNDCHAAFTRYLAGVEAGRASRAQSEWISVEDRVPEVIGDEDTPVWSWDGQQVREDNYCTEWDQPAGPMVGGWVRIGENFDSSGHGATVTHWMARTPPNPPSPPATLGETK